LAKHSDRFILKFAATEDRDFERGWNKL